MIGKVAVGILILFLFFTIATTPIIEGVHSWRTEETTQNAIVTTTSNTSTNVVLTEDLFSNSTSEIVSITSSISETPVATSYTEATNTLAIAALSESQTRTLTIVYYAPVSDVIMTGVGPFLTPLIFLFIIGMVVAGVFMTGGGGGRGRRR